MLNSNVALYNQFFSETLQRNIVSGKELSKLMQIEISKKLISDLWYLHTEYSKLRKIINTHYSEDKSDTIWKRKTNKTFEALTGVETSMLVFWIITPCGQTTSVSALRMETECSSKTLVFI